MADGPVDTNPAPSTAVRSELNKVRDAIGVYRACTEANQDWYDAIDAIVDYAERTMVVEAQLSWKADEPR